MNSFYNLFLLIISGLALTGFVRAAPVPSRELIHRGNNAHNGAATYYSPSEGRGACGWDNHDDEHVIAISQRLWDETSCGQGSSAECGKTATVSWQGKSVKVRIVDECPSCAHDDIDMSPSAFEQLADKDVGRMNGVSWRID
ncbi:hypothetical protein BDV93DRAFT_496221 [Ceratobasidium sp. AG-I]|nr:hypothetical protein BDV93DRAFT_496221 [Ceratobasidium sp. AG-I]